MRAQTVHRQHRQREQHTLAKVRNAENICKFFKHRGYFFCFFFSCLLSGAGLASGAVLLCGLDALGSGAATEPPMISALPPALVIFSSADLENLCACTETADFSSPSPSTLIRSFLPARPF